MSMAADLFHPWQPSSETLRASAPYKALRERLDDADGAGVEISRLPLPAAILPALIR